MRQNAPITPTFERERDRDIRYVADVLEGNKIPIHSNFFLNLLQFQHQ
jgi:hypothetical protein